jgi:hypothetical protein
MYEIGRESGDKLRDRLDVILDREHNRHVAFAVGRNRCLGSHPARIEYAAEGVRSSPHLSLEITRV